MKDATATARTARRLAQIAAVKKIIGGDANTMLIAAVFSKPLAGYDLLTVRSKLFGALEEMKHNVMSSSDADCRKIFSVMRDHPRAEKKRKE